MQVFFIPPCGREIGLSELKELKSGGGVKLPPGVYAFYLQDDRLKQKECLSEFPETARLCGITPSEGAVKVNLRAFGIVEYRPYGRNLMRVFQLLPYGLRRNTVFFGADDHFAPAEPAYNVKDCGINALFKSDGFKPLEDIVSVIEPDDYRPAGRACLIFHLPDHGEHTGEVVLIFVELALKDRADLTAIAVPFFYDDMYGYPRLALVRAGQVELSRGLGVFLSVDFPSHINIIA